MKIRKYKKTDLIQAANIINKTFARFNSKEGTKKGVKDYIEFYTPKEKNIEQIEKQFTKTKIFFVAVEGNKIVGIIRGRPERITNLFVRSEYHDKGIGTKLIKTFENEAKKKKSNLIKAAASLYAVPFYQKMGYKKTTGIRYRYGLKIQPMQKRLK